MIRIFFFFFLQNLGLGILHKRIFDIELCFPVYNHLSKHDFT